MILVTLLCGVLVLLILINTLLLDIVYVCSPSQPSSLFSFNEMRGRKYLQRKSIVPFSAAPLKHSLS